MFFGWNVATVFLAVTCLCHHVAAETDHNVNELPIFVERSNEQQSDSVEGFVVNPCNSGPCQHGGTCRQTGTSSAYTCSCAPTWSGTNCQTRGSACSSGPCQHGGTCMDRANMTSYQCLCTDQWTGVNCQAPNPCATNPCQNGGICIRQDTNHSCICPDGYHGYNCELLGNQVYQCNVATAAYGYISQCPDNATAYIETNGYRVITIGRCCPTCVYRRGLTTVVIDPADCSASDMRQFDIYANPNDSRQFVKYVEYLHDGALLVGVTGDDASQNRYPALPMLMAMGVFVDDVWFEGNFAFVIQKGYPGKTAFVKAVDNSIPMTSMTVTISGTSEDTISIRRFRSMYHHYRPRMIKH